MTEISYRPYESGDEKAILETFNLVFREVCGEGYQDRDMERWRWSFLENPAGYRIMLGMTEDGRVACQYAGIPMKVYTSAGTGQELSFFHAVDSMVHPEFRAGIRKKGAFIEVAKRFFDRFGGSTDELGFGYPVRPAWRIGERYLGYRLIKSLDFLLAEIDVRPSPVPTAVQVEQIERFDAGQDELYESLKNEFPCMLIKDSRYLNWRYADCEDVDYRILQATAEGKARGYLVLRTEASLVPDSATIGDLLNVINFASGNNSLIEASISSDGNGITLQALAPGSTVTVTGGTAGSTAAADLGLLDATFSEGSAFVSRHLIAGLDTVLLHSLNGGSGIGLGSVLLTDRSGSTTTIDFAGAQTLKEVIDLINADSSTGFVASVNQAGNGIALTDESGGAGSLAIEDVTGTLAANLGIAVTDDVGSPFVGNVVNGGNAQLQWVSPQTLLADLNAGQGVRSGEIKITDSKGAVYVVSLDAGFTTVGDVLQRINSVTPDTIVARINDTGDGIVVVDSSGGELSLAIEDIEGGSTAKDLRLAGEAGPSEDFIDGSYEYRIEIHGDDTLQDLVDKINAVGGPFSASTLNQGGTVNPISLSLTSGVSGQAGELTIDSTGIDFGFDTLTKASDAVITIGDDSVAAPLLVRSSTNTLDDVFEGVTLNLLSVSDESVTVSITQDLEGIVGAIESFVTSYNSVLDTIDVATSFDPDTLARGILLGDSTISLIRSRLASVMVREFEGVDPSVSRLFSVGLKLASGSRLEFDEEKFREVYAESPQLVENLFTLEETGFGEFLETALDDLTRDFDGVISRKDDLLESQQALLNGRIDSLNILLDAKRARLEAEFVTLETTLASLLAQQGALASLVQFVT